MENLYLFEILINNFSFEPIEPFPVKSNMKVSVNFADYSIDFDSDGMDDWPEENPEVLSFNLGKSLLFASRGSRLMKQIHIPININVYDIYRSLGSANIPWIHFEKMMNYTDPTTVQPCKIEGQFNLIYKDYIMGTIDVFIRLQFFGTSIKTKFCVKQTGAMEDEEQYTFQHPNMSRTITCKKVFSKECPIPKQVFKSRFDTDVQEKDDNISWAELFKTNLGARFSVANPEFGHLISTVSAFSMLTMGEKPNEKKVKEICEMIQHVVLDLDKEENPDIDKLTVENINEMICKNADCKWVKKFKELGIPINNIKKQKRFEGANDQPVDYGLSKTYGGLEKYGPESKYRKPKRINQPFIPIRK